MVLRVLDKSMEYAGIGTRRLPKDASIILMKFACCMAFAGFRLNSGGADGSDTSFETGAKIAYDAMASLDNNLIPGNYGKVMNIFLPWHEFNGRVGGRDQGYITNCPEQAKIITAPFHPNWERLSSHAQKMMARNALQALSESLNRPVRFVMCQTPDGAYSADMTSSKTGGTGQAIRIADKYGVQVWNTQQADHLAKVQDWISYYDDKIYEMHGISPIQLVDDFMRGFIGINKRVEGNIVQMANRGEIDVLVHGCNCFDMNSGIAKSVREVFPEAFAADRKLGKGNKEKLGSYSSATVERNGKKVTIVNAYTQYKWGWDKNEIYVDYEKTRKAFEAIAKDFPNGTVAIPRIGAGLGNACWVTMSNIINVQMKGRDLLLVDLPDGLDIKNEVESARKIDDGGQMGMFC